MVEISFLCKKAGDDIKQLLDKLKNYQQSGVLGDPYANTEILKIKVLTKIYFKGSIGEYKSLNNCLGKISNMFIQMITIMRVEKRYATEISSEFLKTIPELVSLIDNYLDSCTEEI